MRQTLARFLFGAAIMLVILLAPAAAEACEECFKFFDDEWCHEASAGQSGFTICNSPEEASCCCKFSGNPCTGGQPSGGGGGGGWGGGGGACGGTGFCPAECFSCGGGGGAN